MESEKNRLYDSAHYFFNGLERSAMYLSPDAAIAVCLEACRNGFVVARIEGGLWLNPGFEARMDCIWDGIDPPIAASEAQINNMRAVDFIRYQRGTHDAFIITAPPITGWPHKVARK